MSDSFPGPGGTRQVIDLSQTLEVWESQVLINVHKSVNQWISVQVNDDYIFKIIKGWR